MGRQAFRTMVLLAAVGLAGIQAPGVWAAEGAAPEGSMEEGTGFSMFGTESIKGFDANKIDKDPVCDRSKRPKVFKVEPDEAAPGQKITIKGENFGTKECFHGVAFSATGGAPVQYTLVNDTTIEVVV
ncbi:MAG: hypothetical protein KGN30_13385, partial [Nitrospirota bacterium]|nr:hypothetical protein [Nitrospirota bacterium]